jgi:adenylate cyclase
LSGRPLDAIPAIERAMHLDPAFRAQHLHFLGMAYLPAGEYAAALLKERVNLTPGTNFGRVLLASALGHLGDREEARRIWRELKEINPKYSFSEHFARQPFKNRKRRPTNCWRSCESRIDDLTPSFSIVVS